jgi:hypothetical protein
MAGLRLESRFLGSLCDFCHNLIESKQKILRVEVRWLVLRDDLPRYMYMCNKT